MFDQWYNDDQYPTLYRVDRDVVVDTSRLFPRSAVRRDELPLWVKSFGLQLEPWMPARQLAWIRRADGGWLAIVTMPRGLRSFLSPETNAADLWSVPPRLSRRPPIGRAGSRPNTRRFGPRAEA
jgi:hypothetical protein